MAKVLVFGFGVVGATYGMILDKAGCSVTAVCRTNYSAVKENGMLIRSKIFGNNHYNPTAVQSVSEAASHGLFDYIIVASKAFPGTAELIKDAVTPDITAIVLAQNGIGVEEDYAKLYPSNTIISGVVYLPVTQVSPGVVEHGPLQRFEIGTWPSNTKDEKARAQILRLSDLWKAGGADAPVFEDVQPVKWIKLAVNAAWNPITALTLCDDANYIRSSAQSEAAIRMIMGEIGLIATAAGYPDVVNDEAIERDLERPRSRLPTGGKEPSMLTDVRAGRPIEVEAILGNAVRIGEKYGVQTPSLQLLYTLATARNFALAPDERWKPIARHD